MLFNVGIEYVLFLTSSYNAAPTSIFFSLLSLCKGISSACCSLSESTLLWFLFGGVGSLSVRHIIVNAKVRRHTENVAVRRNTENVKARRNKENVTVRRNTEHMTDDFLNCMARFLHDEWQRSDQLKSWIEGLIKEQLDIHSHWFYSLTLRRLSLGSSCPSIKVLGSRYDQQQKEVRSTFNLSYGGGMEVSTNIYLPYLLFYSFTVRCRVLFLDGKVELVFAKQPYSHWSLSFVSTPQLDLYISNDIGNPQISQWVNYQVEQKIQEAIAQYTLPAREQRPTSFIPDLFTKYTRLHLEEMFRMNRSNFDGLY